MKLPELKKTSILCLASLAPLFLTQCETLGTSVATSGSLKTPSHNLPKDEYPFDADGNYREEWVKSPSGVNTSKRSSSSSSSTSSRTTSSSSSSSRTSGSSYAATRSSGSSSSSSTSSSSSSRSSRSHTVRSGDTLWALSRKYGVSVTAIKSANGLSSDVIRTGSTLKIP